MMHYGNVLTILCYNACDLAKYNDTYGKSFMYEYVVGYAKLPLQLFTLKNWHQEMV